MDVLGTIAGEMRRLVSMIDDLRGGLGENSIHHVIEAIRDAETSFLPDLPAISGPAAAAVMAVREAISAPQAVNAIAVRFLEIAAEINDTIKESATPWGKTVINAVAAARGQEEIKEFLDVIPLEPATSHREHALSTGFSLWQTHAAFALARAAAHYRDMIDHIDCPDRWMNLADSHGLKTLGDDWRIHAFLRAQAGHRAMARGVGHIAAFIVDRKSWLPYVSSNDVPDARRWALAMRDMGRVVRVPALMAGARVARLTKTEPTSWLKEIRRGKEAAYSQGLFEAMNRSPCYRACVQAQRLVERGRQKATSLEVAT